MNPVLYISAAAVLLPLAAGMVKLRSLDNSLRCMLLFVAVAAGVETANVIHSLYHRNNIWLFNIFILIECVFYMFLLSYWQRSSISIRFAGALSFVYLPFWLYVVFVKGSLFDVNNHLFSASALLLMVFSSTTLLRLVETTHVDLFANPAFWIATGILTLYSIDIVLFSLMEAITVHGDKLVKSTWLIHSLFNILANAFYAVGFLCSSRVKN